MIKKEIINQVREQSDIVQIIGEYLPLKKSGKHFRTLCPFHSEKSPSFYVNQERQIYHCFGCGAGGSVVTFLMEYEKLPFPDAIKKLAARLKINIESETVSYKYQQLYDANEFAADFYALNLEKSQVAKDYLKNRKLSNETIKRFRLGYAPSGNLLLHNAKKNGHNEDTLIKAGLIVKKDIGYYDWFYNRIVFPVFSISGKIIGFNARGLDASSTPKYINTLETPIFKKGENLFGLFQAKNYLYQNIPILVEGNFDMLSLVECGINHVIAPLGTALTPHQAQLIRRYSNQLTVVFDGDSAGQAATLRTIETLLKSSIEPRIVILPAQFDPDKYIITYGKDKFDLLVKNSIDFVDFILKIRPAASVIEKKQCLKEIINYITIIDEKVTQELYINKITNLFNVSKEAINSQITKTTKTTDYSAKLKKPVDNEPLSLLEKQIFSFIITKSEFAALAKKEISVESFSSVSWQQIIQLVYDNLETKNISSAQLIDLTDKPELKQIIADYSFRVKSMPTVNEFVKKLAYFKASWLFKLMQKVQTTGNEALLNKLTLEHYEIKKKLSQMRSKKL